MPGIIILSGQEAADNLDILNSTRLQTVPASGSLLFEVQAADADATNFATISIQMPGGDTPLDGVLVPGGNTAALAGVIDTRTAFRASFLISQGGHCVFSVDETGATLVTWRVSYRPIGQ